MSHFRRILAAAAILAASLPGVSRAEDTPAVAPVGTIRVGKLLFLGNSITLHGPLASIGWTGRKSWTEKRESPASPSTSAVRATGGRDPAIITARRTRGAGSPDALASGRTVSRHRPAWRSPHSWRETPSRR